MLDKPTIEGLFHSLNSELALQDVHGELFLVGGAAMCLAYDARASTKDVDALFHPAKIVREAAARVATNENINSNWLSDAVKGYFSDQASYSTYSELSHLKVSVANADYLLSMKCLAMRLGEEFQDLNDVRYLLKHLGIETYEEARDIIMNFYPLERFPQKTLYLLEELLTENPGQ